MTGVSATCRAIDVATGDGNARIRQRTLSTAQNLPFSRTMGLPTDLFLRVGARYMMTSNIDTADGLVNGINGWLRRIDVGVHRQRGEETRPMRMWIEFDDERCGRKLRERH